MKIRLVSIPVQNQDEALKFYTEILGFVKKHDIPVGGENRWLTVVSKEEPEGAELLLEPSPNHFEPARSYQKAVYEAGMPITQFDVENVQEEYERLGALGVKFIMGPTAMGGAKLAAFDDTCGNNIQIVEML